jgi:hypothetical protein
VALPGTTLAFEQADTAARASGYVVKRYVDFSDHVKAELEDQAAQFQNSCSRPKQRTPN